MNARKPISVGGLDEGAVPLRVGLVGHGIQRSRTPAMHVAEGRRQNLDYRYDLFDPEQPGQTDNLSTIIAQAEAQGFAGLNITFPYKQAATALVDDLSDAARKIGAVNTVVFREGRRFGHNTDFWGFAEGFRQGLPDAPRETVLLIGAGGAGVAVGYALVDLGVQHLLIADRRPEAVLALVEGINTATGTRCAHAAPDLEAAAKSADGIVNATPMGMAKLPGLPLDPNFLEPRHWVAEIVYFPLETEFLRVARATGCQTLDGSGMAINQAVRAFHLFTGLTADAAHMRATFEAMGPT